MTRRRSQRDRAETVARNPDVPDPRGVPVQRIFGFGFMLTLLPMLLWALASPIGSVPDEPAHFIRAAAVATGEVSSDPHPDVPGAMKATVPAYVAATHSAPCMAFRPDVTAACTPTDIPVKPDALVVTATTAGTNSPLYYALVGAPTIFLTGDTALYGMRFMNAGLCALMLASMFACIATWGRAPWTLISVSVAVTPMVLYLGGSVNPNGLEVTSAGALLAALLTVTRQPLRQTHLAAAVTLAAVAATLLMGTRSIALLWVLAIVSAALIVGERAVLARAFRFPATWIGATVCGIVGSTTLIWYLRPSANVDTTQVTEFSLGHLAAFVDMLTRTLEFAGGWIGYIGWLDTPPPALAVIVWSFVALALLIGCFSSKTARPRLAAGLLLGVILFVPSVVQTMVISDLGPIWQGRYTLAMVMCLFVICGIALDEHTAGHIGAARAPALRATLIFVACAHVAVFVNGLKRYVSGGNSRLSEMVLEPSWQPPGSWPLLAAAYAGFAVMAYLAVWRIAKAGSERGSRASAAPRLVVRSDA